MGKDAAGAVLGRGMLDSGCSSFSWDTEDGKHLLGRTYDMFGDLGADEISVIGKGYDLPLDPEGKRRVKTRLGMVAMTIPSAYVFVDGINEKGLMGCLLNYPGFGHFNTNRGNGNEDVCPGSFLGYILAACSSVEDVVRAAGSVNLTDEPVYGAVMSVHYIFSDQTGEAVIIEPDEGGLSVYRSTIGVMTNSPGYPWHRTNLRNYLFAGNVHPEPRMIAGEMFSALGHGTGGSYGLPGSYSSPDRFVRLAFAKTFAPKGKDEIDGVTRMFHNFAVVDVPDGFLYDPKGHGDSEYTLCTTVMCSESLTYYLSSCQDRRISALSVERALSGLGKETVRHIDIPSRQDISYLN